MELAARDVLQRVNDALSDRASSQALRDISARDFDESLIDLSNNDYLRMARRPEVIAAAQAATEKWGASSSASPLISGYTEEHHALEARLCRWTGFPHGLIWNSGYAANHGVLSHLPAKGDLVLADRLIHQSMISGLLGSGARLQRYRHLDLDHLQSLLEKAGVGRQVFVVTESVFSMDGDYPDLAAIAKLKECYDFFWIVDEAHATGWYGERGSGLVEAHGVAESVDILVGTLGKGLGSSGAYTLFHRSSLRQFLINFSGEFIYSTYLPPSCAAAARQAIELIEPQSALRANVQARSRILRSRIRNAQAGDSAIVPVMCGSNQATLNAAGFLERVGFRVGAIRPPTVPAGEGRLRISLNSELTEADETRLVESLEGVGQ